MVSMNKLDLFFQVFRFGVVGVIAAAIHFGIVISLAHYWSIQPLVANVFGFAIAFQMSYWGHRWWTFSDTMSLHRVAIPKLFFVQTLNFAANETLFYIFLALGLPYPIALITVLAALPIFTFFASKLWVFA
jgi:putative flippase GtrA